MIDEAKKLLLEIEFACLETINDEADYPAKAFAKEIIRHSKVIELVETENGTTLVADPKGRDPDLFKLEDFVEHHPQNDLEDWDL